MSNYSTVETDKAVMRVHLTDGTMKSFLVTQSQTANAVKFMVCKKLGLDVKEFNIFGLYVIEDGSSSCIDVVENPFALHVKWTSKNNTKSKFLFKRTDEQWPPKPAPAPAIAEPAPTEALQVDTTESDSQEVAESSESGSYEEPSQASPGSSRGYGFGVTSSQLQAATQTQRPAHLGKDQTRQGLLGWLNQSLAPINLVVSNLTTDMCDGVVLFRLLELITHKTLKGWHTSPDNMMLKLDNLNMFLRILGYFGIKISGVSPEDIYSGNENIITAILLLMIKKYTPALKLDEFSPSGGPAPTDGSYDPNTPLYKSPSQDEFNPPSDEAPQPPPGERPLSSRLAPVDPSSSPTDTSAMGAQPRPPSGTEGPLRGRVRSRMVTPDEQAMLSSQITSPGTNLIARAPNKFAVDPSLTPDISSLLGGNIDMPLSNSPSTSSTNSVTPPSSLRTQGPVPVARVGTPPSSGVLPGPPKTGSPVGSRPLPNPQAGLAKGPKVGPKTATPPPGYPGPSGSPPPNMPKTAPHPANGGLPPQSSVKRTATPPKMAPGTAPFSVGHRAPVKYGSPKMPPARSPMVARPLPVPVAKSEPREEMDINIVPQDAMQDAGIPAIEMDFSSPVPGSETASKAHPNRTRASTISNINTNVFDLDAFSDMEDLLMGLADNI